MENFIVSARKYRPTVWDDVKGQSALTNTLKQAIANHKLANAYLFCGPRGVGKTTCARIFAKAINCMNPAADGEACNACESCSSFNDGRSLNIQELNAASNNTVDDIRQLIEQVRIPPQLGKYKVIILDEVHQLSGSAANALLKTLEEPPSYVIFILATTEKQKILPTILSRCQVYDFNRMEVDTVVEELKMVAEKEGYSYDERALNIIAQKADGGMRDALSIFDQVSNFSGGNLTYESVIDCLNVLDYEYYFQITDLVLDGRVSQAMLLLNDIIGKGFDAGTFIGGLAKHLRDVLMGADEVTLPLLDVAATLRSRYGEQAARCNASFLYEAIKICDRCANGYRNAFNKRLSVEIALIELVQAAHGGVPKQAETPLRPMFQDTNPGAPAPAAKPAPQPAPTTPKSAPQAQAAAPKPPASTQPAAAPTKATAPAQPKPATPVSMPRIGGLLRNRQASASAQPAETPAPAPEPKADEPEPANPATLEAEVPFTQEDADKVWEEYLYNQSVTDSGLNGALTSVHLEKGEGNQLHLVVPNKMIESVIRPQMLEAEQLMRKRLCNYKLTLTTVVRLTARQEAIRNPQAVFERIKQDAPAFARFAEELNLKPE